MVKYDRYLIARRTTIVNSSINTLLALLKIILGFAGHSAALIADGIHSFSDLITDMLVLFATKMGTQKPDKEHPYGHRRIETIATIIIALLLLGVALSIAYETLHRIFLSLVTEKPSYFVIVVAIVSILSNEFLYHYTLYEGKKIDSDLLKSNAWHNRTDALVSIVVLISVIGAILGAPYLDAIGALVIALLILAMAMKMIWNSAKELIDTAVDPDLNHEITQAILNVPGINAIHQLRTRYHGDDVFVDVHIEVNPMISVSEAHYISERVTHSLVEKFKRVNDVTVHIDPENDLQFVLSKDLPDRKILQTLLEKRWQSFSEFQDIQKIQLHYLAGKIDIDVYLPLKLLKNNFNTNETIAMNFNNAIVGTNYIKKITFYYQ